MPHLWAYKQLCSAANFGREKQHVNKPKPSYHFLCCLIGQTCSHVWGLIITVRNQFWHLPVIIMLFERITDVLSWIGKCKYLANAWQCRVCVFKGKIPPSQCSRHLCHWFCSGALWGPIGILCFAVSRLTKPPFWKSLHGAQAMVINLVG